MRVFFRPVLFLILVVGCGKPDAPATTDPKVLFDFHCARCHAQAGEPGGPGVGGSKGPNLTHVGSGTGMTAEWIAAYVRDPKSKRPDAKLMPAFGETLTDEQIRSLAEWLAAKK